MESSWAKERRAGAVRQVVLPPPKDSLVGGPTSLKLGNIPPQECCALLF